MGMFDKKAQAEALILAATALNFPVLCPIPGGFPSSPASHDHYSANLRRHQRPHPPG
jgi:hypothetical protein